MNISSKTNKIINFLPNPVLEEWSPYFEPVELALGQVLYEPGRIIGHLYFPLTAIVSWVHILENGASTEIAITGREGMVGIYLLMGAAQTNNRAIVQKAGSAMRIRLSVVLNSFNQGNAVQKVSLHYAQTLMNQISQVSVCNRHHTLEQQLCRMLLLTLDRQDSQTIVLTQELMASLLGVRREGVTHAAHRLMNQNILHYSRGNITVLDRKALEKRACECYSVISREYDRFSNMPL
ncbi:Crp/Fnr family transcriptional regulator [Limnohabitans sp. T6-20]|nr:Crp/Fnr family transcriptional regulator [Limnohabitans sp. T6-20]